MKYKPNFCVLSSILYISERHADSTYIWRRREFVFFAVIMDAFTCTIRGWHLDRNLDPELALTALQRVLERHMSKIHHSDRGVR